MKIDLNRVEATEECAKYLWNNHKEYVKQFRRPKPFVNITKKTHVVDNIYTDELEFYYEHGNKIHAHLALREIVESGTINMVKKIL